MSNVKKYKSKKVPAPFHGKSYESEDAQIECCVKGDCINGKSSNVYCNKCLFDDANKKARKLFKKWNEKL